MKPRLARSPASPASAPMATDPAYHSGFSRLGREPSSSSRSRHQARWSPSSAAARRRASRVSAARAVNACPWYSPWAAISPAWLTRMSPAACRRRAGSAGPAAGFPGVGRLPEGLPKLAERPLSASSRRRSRVEKTRGSMQRILYRLRYVASPVATRTCERRLAALQAPAICVNLPAFHVPDPSQGLKMKTVFAKPERVQRDWYLVDASGKTLGRLATQIAMRLRGKHTPEFTPHVDCGDHIVVLHAEKVAVTGNKTRDKLYHQHTGFLGNMKTISLGKMLAEHPERAIEYAVKGMLPKTILGRQMFRKLHVFAGGAHPHAAQQPKQLEI